jgi:FtsP/CotA-like multicopper oxidase with cupredoxin domain
MRGKRIHFVICTLLAAAGATVLWALPAAKKTASVKAAAPFAVQRLTAGELARTDLGTAQATSWSEPPVLSSSDKKLGLTLTVAYADNTIEGAGVDQKVRLRSYNGGLTGPTLRVKAGDTLNVRLENKLPPEPGMEMEMKDGKCANPTMGFNVTNLHTHGLHISPSGNSDNVLLAIKPGGNQDYKFDILPAGNPEPKPARQYPGTFWYHAHNHGSTAMQLASGMAGALIVEDGPQDLVPEVAAAKERLFIFQQFAYKVNGQGIGEVEKFTDLRANWLNIVKKRTAINGRYKPLVSMRPGEVERWRWIDSGIFTDLPLSIRPVGTSTGFFKMYRIAADGITLPRPVPVGKWELGPGSRADLLVQAPLEKGTYELYKATSNVLPLPGTSKLTMEPANPQILAEIVVDGEPCTNPANPCATKIPDKLRPPTDMLPDITKGEINKYKETEVRFGVNEDNFFTINETCYSDEVSPEFDKRVGDVEQWAIVNKSQAAHPFHIHVNAFQLLDKDEKPGEWRDTILVQPGETVRFRTRFERFDGKFVLHCHILTHEDSGMMALVRVKPKAP